MKELLTNTIGQRERHENCKETNDNDGLDEFVTSIVNNGIDDTRQEESEREESPEQLQINETSKETERQAPITRAEHRR